MDGGPPTLGALADLLQAGADEVGEDVIGHRGVGREADRALGDAEAVEPVPDGIDRGGAEGKEAQVRLGGAEPEQWAARV